jgi:hypothetical protein
MTKKSGTWEDLKRQKIDDYDIRAHFAWVFKDHVKRVRDLQNLIEYHQRGIKTDLERIDEALCDIENTIRNMSN